MNRKRGMIVAGMCAARRMSSRLKGSRGNPAFWRPVTLNWRRSPRLRVLHRENPQVVSWTSIFAPRILQHFSSNLTAVAHSTLFATASSILKPLLTQCSSVLHHRETWRTCFSRERLFSRSSERHSSVERVDLIHVSLPRRSADRATRPGPLTFPRTDRSLSITARSNFRTTRISNSVTSHAHSSVSSFMITVTPAVYLRESAPLVSRYSVESPRIIQRTDMVWRQPPAGAKVESEDVRRFPLETPPNSRTLTFDSPGLNKTAAKFTPPSVAPTFNAAQMDRFVDNVIGRVEKRLRIEQERRGG
jgi:hypothetical protein